MEIFGIYLLKKDLPMVCGKRDSTVDWEVVLDHVLQRRTAETGRLRRRRGGEREPCKFPENKRLFYVQEKCKIPTEEFQNSEVVIQSLPLYHLLTRGRKFRIRAHVTVAECVRRAPAAAYRSCFPAVAPCRLSALSVLRDFLPPRAGKSRASCD